MFTQLKGRNIALVIVLIISLFIPFGQTADAYGVISPENVVDVGKKHFVILKEDGSVWSWGDNTFGQLGANSSPPTGTLIPKPILQENGNRLLNIKVVAAGGYHTVALDNDGKVWSWGSNSFDQLGHSPFTTLNENPTVVAGLPKIIAITAGDNHTLAVDESGQVWAWGRNKYGQIGQDHVTYPNSIIPQRVLGMTDIVAVAAGMEHSIALKRDGSVWTWGNNAYGQLGNGETTNINITPRIVPGLNNIMEIAAGDNHTLALKKDRTTIWAWGSNSYGQLGDGGRDMKLSPVQMEDIRDVKMISAGDNHTIVIKEDGTVWTWGRNTSGTQSIRTSPIQVKGLTNAISIGGGGYFDSYILAIKDDGTVWQWDKDSSDTTTKLPVFKKVSGIEGVMKIEEFPFVQGGQVLFRYIGASTDTDVKAFGSFNDWIELPLVKVGSNVWELQVDLGAGEYEYGFKVNGNWTVDPLNRSKTIDEIGRPLSVLKVVPYATETPIINNHDVTFTYSSFDYNGTLELSAKTSYVAVRGSFSNWGEIPLTKQPNNTWALTHTINPGFYYYNLIVRDATSGAVLEERKDPLNLNLQTDSLGGYTPNTFRVSEQLLTRVPVSSIKLNQGPTIDLIVGEQEPLIATVSPSNATNKNIKWKSSNEAIVSVDAGKMTAHSKGTAVISATAVDGGGESAMVTVTVNQQDNAVSYPKTGYSKMGEKTGVSQTKPWRIEFSSDVDLSSINSNNVYVLNESGVPISQGYSLFDSKTLEISLLSGRKYEPGATYYLFIEDTVKSRTGATLNDKKQMKFTIQL